MPSGKNLISMFFENPLNVGEFMRSIDAYSLSSRFGLPSNNGMPWVVQY
jgi:hypothetical protein